ncbi:MULTISPECIES: hypothetical protein [Hyphobacterium]|uniref:UrcA family protein n=1 Tax=Hyphobacterium vulgare TaxID=1736751 RepID=A0ABV6ZXN4_9PROT
MKIFSTLAVSATLAFAVAAPALSQESSTNEFYFVVDRTDISGERSAQEIYAELVATADAYCAQFGEARQDCTEQMVEMAIGEIEDADLAAVHARVTAQPDGVMTAAVSGH